MRNEVQRRTVPRAREAVPGARTAKVSRGGLEGYGGNVEKPRQPTAKSVAGPYLTTWKGALSPEHLSVCRCKHTTQAPMSTTISFRVDDEIPERLEREGMNPHELAREAFLETIERLERRAALEALASVAKEPIEPTRDSVERGRA